MFFLNQRMKRHGHPSRLLSSLLLLAGLALLWAGWSAPAVHAQDNSQQGVISEEEGQRIFRDWLSGQRRGLSRLETFVIEADVEHRVATPDGERFATYGLVFRRLQDEAPAKGELRYLTLDGDTLDVSERRRVERIISSMMTEELGPLLNGLNLPTTLLSRVRVVGAPVRMLRDGRTMIRYVFDVQPPARQPGLDGPRPGPRGGLRPGARPGAPRMGRPGEGGLGPDGENRPLPRISIFIEEATGRLVMSRIRIDMPGERRLVAETLFRRVDGLDIPGERLVRGDFPMRRRLRTVTVSLDHRTEFRVASLSFENGN